MSMDTIVAFCRMQGYIFVEEFQVSGEPKYTFLDYHGKRVYLTSSEIMQRLTSETLTPK